MVDPRKVNSPANLFGLANLIGSGSMTEVFRLEALKEIKEQLVILNIQVFLIVLAIFYQTLSAIFGPRFLITLLEWVLEIFLLVLVIIACTLGFCG